MSVFLLICMCKWCNIYLGIIFNRVLCDTLLFSRVHATLQPALSVRPSVGPSVRWSVRPSVRHTLLFLGFCGFWPHCSYLNDQVTSNTAPAHPHATGVAVYPALFL